MSVRPASPVDSGAPKSFKARVEALLAVARVLRTGVPLPEFLSLLPAGGPQNVAEMLAWFEAHPQSGWVREGYVFPYGMDVDPAVLHRARKESAERIEVARDILSRDLRSMGRLLRYVAVTGSTAFGSAQPEDDLDFFVVTRKGTLWTFLLVTYILGRLRSRKGIQLCLNYVLDERSASREFLSTQHIIFAREALVMKPVFGREYGARLLAQAPWIHEMFPRIERLHGSSSAPSTERSPLFPVLTGVGIFPFLATYLVLLGLYRSGRYSKSGQFESAFRTDFGWRRLSYKSEKYDHLLALYGGFADRNAAEASESTVPGPGSESVRPSNPGKAD